MPSDAERRTLKYLLTRILGNTPFEPKDIVLTIPSENKTLNYHYVDILQANTDFNLDKTIVERALYDPETDTWTFELKNLALTEKHAFRVTVTKSCVINVMAKTRQEAEQKIAEDSDIKHRISVLQACAHNTIEKIEQI